jgi:hypothetical protein
VGSDAEVSGGVTAVAAALLATLFGTSDSREIRLSVRAMRHAADPAPAAASLIVLTNDLVAQIHDS